MKTQKWPPICAIALLLVLPSTAPAGDAALQNTESPASAAAVQDGDENETPVSGPAAPGVVQLITLLTVFVLAIFVGFEVITKVPPTLHTPLMSGSNAISGITVIGALTLVVATDSVASQSGAALQLSRVMATVAVALATINVVGGFLVTGRMLRMFKRT
jgi:NAD(P) transhydrogenase subunit alpha